MPFKSEKQRRFMHARHPEIAKRWEDEEKRGLRSAMKDSRQQRERSKRGRHAAKHRHRRKARH